MPGYDAIALRILMSDRPNEAAQADLKRTLAHARCEYECPECGSAGPHEPSGDGETALCYECGFTHEIPDLCNEGMGEVDTCGDCCCNIPAGDRYCSDCRPGRED